MCFAVMVEESKDGNGVEVKFWTETRSGPTPAQGHFGNKDGSTIQQMLPPLSFPSYDPFEKNPNVRSAEMFVRQGFSWIQNSIACSILRKETGNKKAKMVVSVVPNKLASVSKDDFEHVLTSIYSYISIIIYLLPMYHMILRLQSEK